MIEAATAAQTSLLGSSTTGLKAQLTGLSIPAPCPLPSNVFPQLAISAVVDVKTGAFSFVSETSRTHLQGQMRSFRVGQEAVTVVNTLSLTGALGLRMEPVDAAPSAFAGVTQSVESQLQSCQIHPAVLDNCTQVGGLVLDPKRPLLLLT